MCRLLLSFFANAVLRSGPARLSQSGEDAPCLRCGAYCPPFDLYKKYMIA